MRNILSVNIFNSIGITTITIIILACLHKLKQFIENGNEIEDNKAILEDLTLEHILPRNPEHQYWENNFSADELDECVELIGNMTLLQNSVIPLLNEDAVFCN